MNYLTLYGWNESLFRQKQKSNFKDYIHGRVAVTHKTCYEIISETGYYTCELTGNIMYGREQTEYPCTGDWVIFQIIDQDKGLILDILPREKTLYRLKSGTVSEKQAIASYIDKAFMVQSVDNYFNVRRIERFMLQLAEENIQPVLVLSKTDLDFDKDKITKELNHISHKIPVFYTSTREAGSIDNLRDFIQKGETAVLIGMSGVGKSTLINLLCKQEIFATGNISESTGKGKHTSTRREMVLMENAGVLVDTPGVKLFGVTNDDQDSLSELLDISKFEKNCRFSDCKHINEKGCAVIEAVKNGEIDQGVYDNYLKLRKEAWHYSSSVHDKRKREKSFARMVKEVKNSPFKKRE